ncbi:MAG TPA: magnesium transporter [Leptolyngbyaceae cyanobacterium M65_K2018_010]|nr:magnesium transporter [Leptolyngbyaceae cyanobacterium M65_K2018_010]
MTGWPPDKQETAAEHLVQRVITAQLSETVGTVLARIPGQGFDSIEDVYVLDPQGRLVGLARLTDLLALPSQQDLATVMAVDPPRAYPTDDQERVAGLAVDHHLAAVPVTDREGYFLGVVPAPALIAILRREHIEDLHRLAGIQRESNQALRALEAPPQRRTRDRLPWLLVGLLGSILATFIVSRFEQTLESRVAVAFFVPGIVYLADAIGTQTEAIAVRGLSLSQNSIKRLLLGELRTGLMIGLCLGGLSWPLVWLGFRDVYLALAVALAILIAGGVATTVGLLFPWMLYRSGKDPAFGSGPVATIVQDVLSLLIYFVIVQGLVM